jgi:hypothetical protein
VTSKHSGETKASIEQAVLAAPAGDRLTVRGTCLGSIHVGKDLELRGIRTEGSGVPTLDGAGQGAVVRVKPGVTVTLRGVSIQGGDRGILNRGRLALHDVIVHGNHADLAGAGAYNAAGGTLTLHGSTSIRRNTASGGGGGVLNAGTLVLSDSSSITGNVANAGSAQALGVGDGIDEATASSPSATVGPLASASPSFGSGGGVMNIGIMLGAVCAPAEDANIRANHPDDCRQSALAAFASSPAP